MFRYTNSISTPTRHKRPKRSKTPTVAVLTVIGVFCCSTSAIAENVPRGLDVVAGRDAEQIIVRGKQIDYWKERRNGFLYHYYVIHTNSRVFECFHYRQERVEPFDLVVRCFGHKDNE